MAMHGPTLTLTIAPSRWMRIALLTLHGLAGLAVLLADFDWWIQGILLIVTAASLAFHLRSHPPLELRAEPDGILLIRAGDDWQPVALLPSTMVTPALTVLHFRHEWGKQGSHVILPDSLPADDFRLLRIWLKWKALIAGGSSREPSALDPSIPNT